ncbi:MAG TPA: hypothetical protein VMW85_03820 [Methanomassiliicoccales archaeon]|nr:hypothetical protein [Methanomassiliicoccales archaeon]
MPILPIALLDRGSIGIMGDRSVTNSGGRVNGSGDCMTGNMCGRQRLTCGTGSGTSRVILLNITRRRMCRKSVPTYIGHPEHTRSCPCA